MKMKNRIAGIKAKIGREAVNVLKTLKEEKSKISYFLAFNIFMQTAMPAVYASGLSEAKDLMKEPVGIVAACVSGLGAVMILIAIIQYMVSEDPQAGAAAKKRIKTIIIAWIALLCTMVIADVIISFAETSLDSLYHGKI